MYRIGISGSACTAHGARYTYDNVFHVRSTASRATLFSYTSTFYSLTLHLRSIATQHISGFKAL